VRRLLIACLLLAGCGGSAPEPFQPQVLWPAPERYEVDARWEKNRLSGRVHLTLRNTGPKALEAIWLRTWPNAYGGCGTATLKPSAETSVKCTAQRVDLAKPLAPGARTTVDLEFTVDVPPGADRFGRTKEVAYLGNALPTLAVADEEGWRLPPYFNQGEAWFSLSAAWRVKLDAPGQTVASTGTETSPGVYEAEKARDFALVIGDLRVRERRVGDITVRHFALPRQPAAQAGKAMDAAKAALDAYQEWFGPYGRSELDLVQGPAEIATRGIAMEYPELVLTPPTGAAVAHEVAHQWWAFQMGNDPSREPFLDEGFAEYSAARLPRSVTGGNRLGKCAPPKKPLDPPITADVRQIKEAGGRTYVRTIYVGAACFLRRLEKKLGQDRFDRMLRGLVKEHRDRTWTRGDLIRAIEQAAPDERAIGAFLAREGVIRPVE
jgi:hypothetical protein